MALRCACVIRRGSKPFCVEVTSSLAEACAGDVAPMFTCAFVLAVASKIKESNCFVIFFMVLFILERAKAALFKFKLCGFMFQYLCALATKYLNT